MTQEDGGENASKTPIYCYDEAVDWANIELFFRRYLIGCAQGMSTKFEF